MKKFVNPELSILALRLEDVICTSNITNQGSGENNYNAGADRNNDGYDGGAVATDVADVLLDR